MPFRLEFMPPALPVVVDSKYQMLTVDLRGHGFSKRYSQSSDYHPQQMAEDVTALLDDLNIHEGILVAHSLGTLVALELSRIRPNRFPMILISPNYKIKSIVFRKLMQPGIVLLSKIFDALPMVRQVRERTDYSRHKNSEDFSIGRIAADVWNTTLRVYIHCLVQVYVHAQDDAWSSLAAPVSIIHGEKDMIVPASHARALAEALPNSELHIMKDANHVLVLNNVPQVTRLIQLFAASIRK